MWRQLGAAIPVRRAGGKESKAANAFKMHALVVEHERARRCGSSALLELHAFARP